MMPISNDYDVFEGYEDTPCFWRKRKTRGQQGPEREGMLEQTKYTTDNPPRKTMAKSK
jgi:hypothetical protein